jgi:hypothetical protein
MLQGDIKRPQLRDLDGPEALYRLASTSAAALSPDWTAPSM